MVDIPTRLLKKLVGFAALLFVFQVFAQTPEQQLLLADSLFRQKKYTQAFQTYQTLEQHGFRSDAMLLRMAYIQEGLGHIPGSLLYLNRYWAMSGDAQVVEKIGDMAQKKKLSGYEYSSIDRLKQALAKHKTPLALSGSGVLGLLLAGAYLTRKKSAAHRFSLAGVVVFSLLFGLVLTQAQATAFGISNNAVYLMRGPSGGSAVVARIDAGHRLPLMGERDVWLKTEWNGTTAYVRKSNVQLIN